MQSIDPTLEFRFSLQTLLIPISVAAAAALVALFAHRRGRTKVRRNSILVALVAGLIFAPSMYLDVVRLSALRIEQSRGIPFLGASKGFSYDEVSYVHIKEVWTWKGHREIIWEIHRRDGTTTDLNPGDLWEWNSDKIIPYLKARGVEFQ